MLRDQKKAKRADSAGLLPGCDLRVTRALQGWRQRRRTFALSQSLERRFVAHRDLARLHDQSQARVDALNARLLLLQSTGRDGRAEATAVAEKVWVAHNRCEQVRREPGDAGGGRATAAILTRAKERTFPLAVSPILPARTCGRLERRGSERGELKETNAKISKHIWSVFFAPCRPPFAVSWPAP